MQRANLKRRADPHTRASRATRAITIVPALLAHSPTLTQDKPASPKTPTRARPRTPMHPPSRFWSTFSELWMRFKPHNSENVDQNEAPCGAEATRASRPSRTRRPVVPHASSTAGPAHHGSPSAHRRRSQKGSGPTHRNDASGRRWPRSCWENRSNQTAPSRRPPDAPANLSGVSRRHAVLSAANPRRTARHTGSPSISPTREHARRQALRQRADATHGTNE